MAALMAGVGQGDRRERFQTEVQMAVAAPQDAETTVKTVTSAIALERGAERDHHGRRYGAASRCSPWVEPCHQADRGGWRGARHQEQARADPLRLA